MLGFDHLRIKKPDLHDDVNQRVIAVFIERHARLLRQCK